MNSRRVAEGGGGLIEGLNPSCTALAAAEGTMGLLKFAHYLASLCKFLSCL